MYQGNQNVANNQRCGGANNGSEVVAVVVCRVDGSMVASVFLATARRAPAVHSHLETESKLENH